MLTNLDDCRNVNSSKGKCEIYWPNQGENMTVDGITVTGISTIRQPGYIKTEITVESEGEIRGLRHYLFTDWPDRSVPTDLTSLENLLGQLEIEKNSRTGPVVVHCSAGVGRTGTFIALDTLKKILDSQKQNNADLGVSVFSVVRRLREQRVLMVQTDLQYRMLYRFVQRWLS